MQSDLTKFLHIYIYIYNKRRHDERKIAFIYKCLKRVSNNHQNPTGIECERTTNKSTVERSQTYKRRNAPRSSMLKSLSTTHKHLETIHSQNHTQTKSIYKIDSSATRRENFCKPENRRRHATRYCYMRKLHAEYLWELFDDLVTQQVFSQLWISRV